MNTVDADRMDLPVAQPAGATGMAGRAALGVKDTYMAFSPNEASISERALSETAGQC